MPHYDIEHLRELVKRVAPTKQYPQQSTEQGSANDQVENGKPDQTGVVAKQVEIKPLPIYTPPTKKPG